MSTPTQLLTKHARMYLNPAELAIPRSNTQHCICSNPRAKRAPYPFSCPLQIAQELLLQLAQDGVEDVARLAISSFLPVLQVGSVCA